MRRWFGSVRQYAFELFAWLRRGPLVALVAVTTFVFLIFFFVPCVERQIRISGMVLQLAGVILVGVGLRDTRQAFDDQPTTLGAIKQWWSGRPRFGPKHTVVAAAGVSVGAFSGSARMRVGAGPNTSLDQRVTMLEQGYASLFDEVGTLSGEVKKKTDELSKALKAEQGARAQAITQTKDQLKRAVAEGIPLASVGVIFFLLGVTAGTASPEIASIFGSSACQ